MLLSSFDTLVSFLRRLVPEGAEREDHVLLRGFLRGDESAFTALVCRYAPLVWGVCSRTLSNSHDAEDAFQATFLVLARRSPSLSGGSSLGPWLHRVASRTAVKARARAARRTSHEKDMPVEPLVESKHDGAVSELRAIIDEEVGRLPEKYRLPVVLCYMEGLTNEEAARRLACPYGTILSRLSRARELLRGRLLRRGLGIPAAGLAAVLGESATANMPSAVVENLLRAGPLLRSGAFSASVLTLAEGVLSSMFQSKLRFVGVILLGLGLIASGVGLFAATGGPSDPGRGEAAPPADSRANGKEKRAEKPAPAKPAAPPAAGKPLAQAEISKLLGTTIDFPGIDDPKIQLEDALDLLGRKYNVKFEFRESPLDDERADEEEGSKERKIKLSRRVPPMRAPLRRVVEKLVFYSENSMSYYPPVFVIHPGRIEIANENEVRGRLGRFRRRSMAEMLNPVTGAPAGGGGIFGGLGGSPTTLEEQNAAIQEYSSRLPPLVWQEFHQTPLSQALTELAETTDFNVVVDVRVEEKTKVKVSARLANVPVDTAVELLTDMAGLAVVRMDNVFYVTSAENAAKMKPKKTKT